MRVHLRARLHPRGQVLIIVGVALTIFIGVIGLAVDYGFWLTNQRALRNAADAASQAGVSEVAELPVTAAQRTAASQHAMMYLNDQLRLGLGSGEIAAAASAALASDGFGSEDGTSYSGTDRFLIRTPVSAADSCTGRAWGKRSINVKVERQAPRFFSAIFFGGSQEVDGCATSVIEGRGYAVAVLKPNTGVQPNNANITMKLAGTNSFVRICGGDVGINATFGGGPQPPPNSASLPAYVKFMKPNSIPPCLIDNENEMLLTIENPSPMSWSQTSIQVRVEGATSADTDDVYQAPVHLQNYIQIPTWGQAYYAALNDAAAPVKHLTASAPGLGTCPAPSGYDPVEPGKFTLLATGTSSLQFANRWLCPGVYHFVPTNGQQGLQLGSNTNVAGEGVTLVFETGPNHNQNDSVASVQSGSALVLNLTTAAPWRTGDARHDVPITVWIKPDPTCPTTPIPSCSDSSVFNVGADDSGIDIRGIIFGPTDNMKISGNASHHGAGEIWAWTIEYKGGSQLDQIYEGGDAGWPLLVE